MTAAVSQLAERIKASGRHSTDDLGPLLVQAESIAADLSQDPLTRALAHRAAGDALLCLTSSNSPAITTQKQFAFSKLWTNPSSWLERFTPDSFRYFLWAGSRNSSRAPTGLERCLNPPAIAGALPD